MQPNNDTRATKSVPAAQDRGEDRRQADRERIRESLRLLEVMPARKLVAPGADLSHTDVRGLVMLLRLAIKSGEIDMYTAGPGPDRTFNCWDYPGWERLEVHEWIARELARAAGRDAGDTAAEGEGRSHVR